MSEEPETPEAADETAGAIPIDKNERNGLERRSKKSRLKKWLIIALLLLLLLLGLLCWRFQNLPPQPFQIESIIPIPTATLTNTPVIVTETKVTKEISNTTPANTPLPPNIETWTPGPTIAAIPSPTPMQFPSVSVSTPTSGSSRKELELTVEALKYAWATDSVIQSEKFRQTTEANAATSNASFYATLTAQPTETSTGTPTETRTPTITPTQTSIPPSLTPTPTKTATGTPVPTATVPPTPVPTATFPPL